MNSERIKEIQAETAYPESVSVMIALKKVWNECAQEQNQPQSLKQTEPALHTNEVTCLFSYNELQYMLVMITEGQDKINSSKSFEGYQNYKIQETIIDKIRKKCWECHHNGMPL
jgi:hypothetical protein